MTKREMYTMTINILNETSAPEKDELIAGLQHEIDLLNSKSSASRKPTKTQIENDGFKATIVAHLSLADTSKTIKELQSEISDLATLSNQRITHMLTDLVKAGTLTKDYVKKTPYYSIAV